MNYNSKLVLENGQVFKGFANASKKEVIGEVVFNTSMVGYQEIATDPAYFGKIVVMTYPLIGNYGINDEDNESKGVKVAGVVVKECNDAPSNFRFTKTFAETLEEADTPLISGFDTRKLTRIIRDNGSQLGLITDINTSDSECLKKLKEYNNGRNLVAEVSTKKKWISRAKNPRFHVVCIDLGTKLSVIKQLNDYKCNVTVVPYNTSLEEIMDLEPNGILVSNGPGNPECNKDVIEVVKNLSGKLPILGINLGHLVVALAHGAKVEKMTCGNNGSTHAVKNLETGKLQTVSQTNQYTVVEDSIKKTKLEVNYIDVATKTVEGLKNDKDFILTVQYNPDNIISPLNAKEVFGKFIDNMNKGGANNA